jgi:hypothetical protein
MRSRLPSDCAFILLPDDLDQDAFAAQTVKLAIEYLLPRSEIQSPVRDRDNDFTSHNLALQVRVCIVLPRAVVKIVIRVRIERGQLFQPRFKIVVQAGFVVVDKDTCRDVHGIAQKQSFFDSAFTQALIDLRRNVQEPSPPRILDKDLFPVIFHRAHLLKFIFMPVF